MQCLLLMSLSQWLLLSSVRDKNHDAPFEYGEKLLAQLKSKEVKLGTDQTEKNWLLEGLAATEDPFRKMVNDALAENPIQTAESADKLLEDLPKGGLIWPTTLESVQTKGFKECADVQSDTTDQTTGDNKAVVCRYTIPCN